MKENSDRKKSFILTFPRQDLWQLPACVYETQHSSFWMGPSPNSPFVDEKTFPYVTSPVILTYQSSAKPAVPISLVTSNVEYIGMSRIIIQLAFTCSQSVSMETPKQYMKSVTVTKKAPE